MLLSVATAAVGVVAAATFRAELEPNAVYVGQVATLNLICEGERPDVLPPPPTVPNLTIRFAGRQDSFTVVNGRASSASIYRHTVVASQPGRYVIPAITVKIDNQVLQSQPVELTVAAGNPQEQAGPSVPRAFLRITVPRTNLYVGEALPVELGVYAINPQQYELGTLPAEGFTLGKQERLNTARVEVNGLMYTKAGVRTVVSPTRTGTLTLGPLSGRVQVSVPVARRRGGALDDFFNDPFFNRSMELAVADVVAERVTVQVEPLPADGVPGTFLGAVGRYTLEVTAGPTNVAVGDPIRLRVQISGRGQLEGLTLPGFDGWTDFRVYPAVSRVETTDALGVEGAKVIEHDVVPQNAGVTALPAIAFSYFDPLGRAYVTLTNPPVPILVRPVGSRAPTLTSSGASPPPREIVHLKPRPGTLAQLRPPVVQRPWFWLLSFTPLAVFAGAAVWRRRQDSLARNPRERRRREVARKVRSGLETLGQAAARGDSREVFALVFRLLQEQLGERLDLPAASITEAVLEERLVPAGAAAGLVAELRALFQACNQARYAPAGSVQDLQDTVRRLERVIDALRRAGS